MKSGPRDGLPRAFRVHIAGTLRDLDGEGLRRTERVRESPDGRTVRIGGRRLLSFGSNNYLGLASHPALAQAAARAAAIFGSGAGAARLITGTTSLHLELEEATARFLGREAACSFPAGYLANAGVIPALAGRGDLILSDALNHASLIDGCRLSRAQVRVFPHRDAGAAERLLREWRRRGKGRALIASESLFSMDGDLAPLRDLAEIAARRGALLLVDEAHAFGVLGPGGRGAAAAAGVEEGVGLLMGTYSKAAGAAGGFVAGAREVVDFVKNRCRTFLFTTAAPPPVCAAALSGLRLLARMESARRALLDRAARFRDRLRSRGFDLLASESQILPVIAGGNRATLALSARILRRGILAPAIRPPTVPPGAGRLRHSLTAAHTDADLARLEAALGAPPGARRTARGHGAAPRKDLPRHPGARN